MSILTTKKTEVEKTPSGSDNSANQPLFGRNNYLLMAAGVAIMVLGYVLMVGGSSDANPEVFNKAEKYSTVRITVAPILILVGMLVQIPAIMMRRK